MRSIRVPAVTSATLVVLLMASLAVAQDPKPPYLTDSPQSDDSVLLFYNPDNGELGFTTPEVEPQLTTLEIKSTGNLFLPENCLNLAGDFDVCSSGKIAKISVKGFGPMSFGNILPKDLSYQTVVEGFIADGSYLTGGTLGKYNEGKGVGFYVPVPEPSGAVLGLLGLLGLLLRRRR